MTEPAGKERSPPQVFVVDAPAPAPAPAPVLVPFRPVFQRFSAVHLLLSVALLGVCIEAGLIWNLYSRPTLSSVSHKDNNESSDFQKMGYSKGGNDLFDGSTHESNEIIPDKTRKAETKPAAFLQSASPLSTSEGVLRWRPDGFPVFIRGLEHHNNSLICLQDGVYFLFSKLSYRVSHGSLKHSVMMRADRYSNKPLELMQSYRFLSVSSSQSGRDSSYLAGVFQLDKGDHVFVQVSNSSLVHYEPNENFFGAFMV
ncbi:tumor necrosis factor ligand superfamily member 14 [Danio aesculapii]|uniref:tumor necrosis factor ligand superfamily member 14 n=1 Tax=Danio aesculapii TaxID=1142201 RepID=UPI0024C01F19|nr:tumor necrosis factor ligand superfamily member 14 [Danio aesculapii]